jgi:hypothetical protein
MGEARGQTGTDAGGVNVLPAAPAGASCAAGGYPAAAAKVPDLRRLRGEEFIQWSAPASAETPGAGLLTGINRA